MEITADMMGSKAMEDKKLSIEKENAEKRRKNERNKRYANELITESNIELTEIIDNHKCHLKNIEFELNGRNADIEVYSLVEQYFEDKGFKVTMEGENNSDYFTIMTISWENNIKPKGALSITEDESGNISIVDNKDKKGFLSIFKKKE